MGSARNWLPRAVDVTYVLQHIWPTTSNDPENSIVWIEAEAAMKCFVFSEAYLPKHLFADM